MCGHDWYRKFFLPHKEIRYLCPCFLSYVCATWHGHSDNLLLETTFSLQT